VILRALLRLLSLVALALAGWWIARGVAGAGRPRAAAGPRDGAVSGRMVRDRVCNTFLPHESAIAVRVGNETHYFCSDTCRSRFLRESATAQPAR